MFDKRKISNNNKDFTINLNLKSLPYKETNE